MNLRIKIELEALITEREGMVAFNQHCKTLTSGLKYDEKDFKALADKMRALAGRTTVINGLKAEMIVHDEHPESGAFLQCSICNKVAEDKSKVAGDICRAAFSKGEGIEKCQGVLRQG